MVGASIVHQFAPALNSVKIDPTRQSDIAGTARASSGTRMCARFIAALRVIRLVRSNRELSFVRLRLAKRLAGLVLLDRMRNPAGSAP